MLAYALAGGSAAAAAALETGTRAAWSAGNTAMHGAIAAATAVVAFFVAWMLASLGRRGAGPGSHALVASAFVALGVFHGASALLAPGSAAWLDSAGALVAGLLLAGVWVPGLAKPAPRLARAAALALAIALALAMLAGTGSIPAAIAEGELVPVARWSQVAGGALWLASVPRLLASGSRRASADVLVLGAFAGVRGGALLLAAATPAWPGGGFGGHGLVLACELVVLGVVLRSDRRAQAETTALTARILRHNASLEERLSAHTAQLEAALELAESANRAKSEFLANMSHEIRSPLNAVIGLTEVVLGTELNEFQRDHLRTVLDSGDVLLGVINQILDFSKIEAGKMVLERVRFSLEDTVCDALKPLAVRAQGKGLELSCLIDPAVPRAIVGDPVRLRQVITNLTANAITYTESGEVLVRVAHEAASSLLHVAVLDSGVGIGTDQLERVFESFEQADTSTTRRFGGTGLGLAISRELVRLMGGEIRAESEVGVGSTFSFSIPCEVAPGAERTGRDPAFAPALAGVPILLVDDNRTQRTILDRVARSAQMRPILAATAEEALAALGAARARGTPIPVVVSDVHMPGTDGYGLAEALRREPAFDDVAIVLLTSAVENADAARCERLRVRTWLMKPVKPSELIDAIAAILGREATGARRDPAGSPPPAGRAREPLRILLVEDSPANRKLAIAVLESLGHAVTVAENGRIAVEQCTAQRFDVVLMDIQMPEMDGFETTAAIREAEPGGRRVPIIAMTAHALRGDRERCLAGGMDDYLAKPVRRADLVRALARVAARPAAVDWSVLLAQASGDREVLRERVRARVSELQDDLDRLPRLIAAEAWPEVRRLARTVTGAMRTFGVRAAQQAGERLEEQAGSASGAALGDLFAELAVAVEEVLPELVRFAETGCTHAAEPGSAEARRSEPSPPR